MVKQGNNKYWVGVCYPENMVENWQEYIGDIIELPFAYCVHDKDYLAEYNNQESERKLHVHIIIAFNNTTTYKHALDVFNKLSKEGATCCPFCEAIIKIRNKFEYLIHNTETSKKLGKYLYPVAERITGNNFDIGSYEQISMTEKNSMAQELCNLIVTNKIVNFVDFYNDVFKNYDVAYFDIIKSYSGLFERLCKGNYLKFAR